MSRKVAEFSIDISPDLVNNSLEEMFGLSGDSDLPIGDVSDDVENIDDDNNDVFTGNTKEPEEQEPEEDTTEPEQDSEEPEESTEEPEDDKYKDHSSVALLALALKDINADLIPNDVEKNLSPKDLLETLQSNIDKIVEKKTTEIEEKYDSAANYLTMLVQGVNTKTIEYGLRLRQIGDIELDDDTSEDDLAHIVDQGLIQKGIDEEERKDLIETLKDKGKLYDRAEKTIQTFKELEEEYVKNVMDNRKEEERRVKATYAETKKKIQSVVDKGIAKGLPIKDKKKLLDSIYSPTETIEQIDPNGKKVLAKTTLYDLKYKEFQADMEQQVAFAQLLLNGFDFAELVTVAKKSVNDDIIKALDRKEGATTKTRSRDSRNPWYDL